MQELSTTEYKAYLVKMLKDFDDFCRKNDIEYSIAYGTMLGAVRHGGFIPWDDDIDVLMTRKNFEFLIQKYKENDDYYLLTNKDKNYNLLFSKIVSKKTLIVSKHVDRYKNDLGLYIDVFPMDYLKEPKSEGIKILQKNRKDVALLVAAQWGKFYRNENRSLLRELIRFPFFLISRFVNSKKLIARIEKRIEKSSTKLITSYATITEQEIHDSCIFNEYEEIKFENISVMCIKNRDSYLKTCYGNYMILPPKNKRINSHKFAAYIRT